MEITGILHCHSRYSYDAKLTLREIRDLFITRGIRFVCMTEHTDEMDADSAEAFVRECAELSDGQFLFIPGFEVPYKHAHILMIGARRFHDRYAPHIDALLPWVHDASFVVLAHPVRNDFEVDDRLLDVIHGLEVWNQQYEGKRVPRTRSLSLINELKEKKPLLVATGGVDFHRREHFGTPTVSLSVEDLTEENVLEKLKMGAFTVESGQTRFFGTLPNADELRGAHRLESALSVCVIVLGKWVNKTLATFGISLPSSLKEFVRRRF